MVSVGAVYSVTRMPTTVLDAPAAASITLATPGAVGTRAHGQLKGSAPVTVLTDPFESRTDRDNQKSASLW